MKYVYKYHPSKLATLIVGFGAGSRVEFNSRYHKGTAHISEHAHFLGANGKDKKALSRQLALVGGSWNAFTSNDIVCYHISIPEENLAAGCEILGDVVMRPDFPDDELTKEKEVICQEVRMYDDEIDSLVNKRLYERVFNNSLRTPIIGFEDTVRQTTRQDLLDFNTEFYAPDQMAIVLAAPNDYEGLITKYFSANDGQFKRIPRATRVEYVPSFEDEVVKEGLIQDTISISFGNQTLFDRSIPKFDARNDIFNRIFGGSDVSRLFMKVREDLGLVYGIRSGFDDHLDGSLFGISTLTGPDNRGKVVDAINSEIDRMLKEPANKEELSMAKNKYKSQMYRSMDSSFGAVNQALSEVFFDSKPLNETLAEVEALTAEDLIETAQTVFAGSKYVVVGHGKDG
jgi:predicted Zn-dependent peptidase